MSALENSNAAAEFFERVTATPTNPAAAAEFPAGATHNNYSLYVPPNKGDDLIGLVAYSLYKQHKINFFQSELVRTKKPATEEKIKTFCDVYSEPQQVELLREQARTLLENMNEGLLMEAIVKLNKDYDKRLKKELKDGLPLSKSVYHSVVGNLVTGVVIATAVWITTSSFDDLLASAKKIFSNSTVQTTGSN